MIDMNTGDPIDLFNRMAPQKMILKRETFSYGWTVSDMPAVLESYTFDWFCFTVVFSLNRDVGSGNRGGVRVLFLEKTVGGKDKQRYALPPCRDREEQLGVLARLDCALLYNGLEGRQTEPTKPRRI